MRFIRVCLDPCILKKNVLYFDPIWIYFSLFVGCLVETQNYCIPFLAFTASSSRVTEKEFSIRKVYSLAHTLLSNVFSALKGTHFYKRILFVLS